MNSIFNLLKTEKSFLIDPYVGALYFLLWLLSKFLIIFNNLYAF